MLFTCRDGAGLVNQQCLLELDPDVVRNFLRGGLQRAVYVSRLGKTNYNPLYNGMSQHELQRCCAELDAMAFTDFLDGSYFLHNMNRRGCVYLQEWKTKSYVCVKENGATNTSNLPISPGCDNKTRPVTSDP